MKLPNRLQTSTQHSTVASPLYLTQAAGLLALALLSAGCKPNISNANIEAVNQRFDKSEQNSRKTLSPKEVESILGPPDRVENSTIELETQKKQVPLTHYYYEQDGKVIQLHFFDNKLISRIPHWDTPAPTEPQKP